jgi:DNA repair protein RecO (recombination protein O)
VVTFITREKGLLTAVAKNARQSVRRFGGNLLGPGAAAWYYFRQRPRSDMALVERGEHNPKAPVLPADPVCATLAAWALELVRAFEAHENPAAASFNLLVRHLGALAKTPDFSPPALEARRLSVGFTKRYLELAGFSSALDRCSVCSRPGLEARHWDPVLGGVVCLDCLPYCGRDPSRAPEGLLEALRLATDHANCLPLDERQLLAAEIYFQTLATLQAGRQFKSRKVLRELLLPR